MFIYDYCDTKTDASLSIYSLKRRWKVETTLAESEALVNCSSWVSSCAILSLSEVTWSLVVFISFSMSCNSSFNWSASYDNMSAFHLFVLLLKLLTRNIKYKSTYDKKQQNPFSKNGTT